MRYIGMLPHGLTIRSLLVKEKQRKHAVDEAHQMLLVLWKRSNHGQDKESLFASMMGRCFFSMRDTLRYRSRLPCSSKGSQPCITKATSVPGLNEGLCSGCFFCNYGVLCLSHPRKPVRYRRKKTLVGGGARYSFSRDSLMIALTGAWTYGDSAGNRRRGVTSFEAFRSAKPNALLLNLLLNIR